MAILQGSVIQAADFTQRAGIQASTRPFPSQDTALQKLSALFGVGWGDRGYGQPVPEISQVTRGSTVLGSDWQGMVTALNTCASYLGIQIPNVPDPSVYAPGSAVTANSFDWVSAIAQVDAVRLTPDQNNLSTQVAFVDTRTSAWTLRPELTFDVSFGNEDAARWFFNSGGQLVINCQFTPAQSNSHNNSWAQLINTDTGTISIGAYNTTRVGGNPSQGFLNSPLGYYTASDSFNTMFSISPVAGPFNVNTLSMSARRLEFAGANGGNGSIMRINVYFDDAYGGPAQPVTGTLSVQVSVRKASQHLQMANPNINLIQVLEGGGGAPFYPFTDVISTTVINYDLLTRARARAEQEGIENFNTIPLVATVIVTPTGVVGSDGAFIAALLVDNLFPGSTVKIINQGYIVGRGGNGGKGFSWWLPGNQDGEPGGRALQLLHATTVINTGVIGGGGGGGGGSSTGASNQTYDDPGGSGGGGAGAPAGSGGPPADGKYGPFEGLPGTLTTGGAGGYPVRIGRTSEWAAGRVGGNGGSLGQPGENGSGDYGFGLGGVAGVAIAGAAFVTPDSVLGVILGATT